MTYTYIKQFLDTLVSDYLDYSNTPDDEDWTLLDKYIFLTQERGLKPEYPLLVDRTIDDWYLEYDELVAERNDESPYYKMSAYIDRFGGENLDGLNQEQIETRIEFNYEREKIEEEAYYFEKEVHIYFNKRITILQRGVRRYLLSKELEKTKLHHLSPVVLDFLTVRVK